MAGAARGAAVAGWRAAGPRAVVIALAAVVVAARGAAGGGRVGGRLFQGGAGQVDGAGRGSE